VQKCIYCESQESKFLFKVSDIFEDTFSLNECSKCSTAFLVPHPSIQQLMQAYGEDYYGEGESKFNPRIEKIIDFLRRRNAMKMASYFGNKGRVLDIGCGNGSFLYNLGLHGEFELFGIELPGKSAERASKIKGLSLTMGELKESTFKENSFDVITLIHVFEHLHNPKQILEIINKILKPEGVLLIEFPNIDSWQAKIFKSNWFHIDPPRHLNFFKPSKFISIVEELGFVIAKESYFSPQFSPYGSQQSILNIITKRRDLLYEHLKGNKDYMDGYSRGTLLFQKLFHWFSFPFFVLTDFFSSIFKKGGTVSFVFRKKG
jgi:SAM-dependent methyltransferase